MKLQLDGETDKKLNEAIKAQPKMLDELLEQYQVTDHSIDALVTILANKYKEIIHG
jgi:hypothetical protein